MAPTSLVLGLLAVLAALVVRRPTAVRLGRPWLLRFLLVQAGLINICLLWLILTLAKGDGWLGGSWAWALPLGYGLLFFFYSIANIDWTVKKFHSEGP